MKWLLWLIVILLIVGVVWWFLNRNSQAPAPAAHVAASGSTEAAGDSGIGASSLTEAAQSEAVPSDPVQSDPFLTDPTHRNPTPDDPIATPVTPEDPAPVEPAAVEPEPEPEIVEAPASKYESPADPASPAYDPPTEAAGSGPDGRLIKADQDSMRYHTPESPWYGRTIGEVWFDTEDDARTAGFKRWDEHEQ